MGNLVPIILGVKPIKLFCFNELSTFTNLAFFRLKMLGVLKYQGKKIIKSS